MSPFTTARGTCRVLYALDVARSIDLTRAEELLVDARRPLFHHKRAFPVEAGVTAPLRIGWTATPQLLGGARGWTTEPTVEVAVYEFGSVVVTWVLPVEGPLEDLVELSALLYENEALTRGARAVAAEVHALLQGAARGEVASGNVEDYVVLDLRAPGGAALPWVQERRGLLARILRAELEPLSEQEVDDALRTPVSYGPDEVALVDWLSAILLGDDMGDERLLLELATVELLELRRLDRRLDRETRTAYDLLARRRPGPLGWTSLRRELQRLARAEADDALLHQGIDNPLELFGDDYLARLYAAAAARFHFDEWDAAIQRKLSTLRGIYGTLEGQASHSRSEILEWIIIVLIAVDIGLVLMGR